MKIRYPYAAETWLMWLMWLIPIVGGLILGTLMYQIPRRIGYAVGYADATAKLQPDIDANALEIAVLNERIVNLRAAMAIETLASWYGGEHHGRRTASGERFDENALTAASPWLPMGSRWTVTRLDTNETVAVTITDRGPHPRLGRGLDLSTAAAHKIGMLKKGVVRVRLEPGNEWVKKRFLECYRDAARRERLRPHVPGLGTSKPSALLDAAKAE